VVPLFKEGSKFMAKKSPWQYNWHLLFVYALILGAVVWYVGSMVTDKYRPTPNQIAGKEPITQEQITHYRYGAQIIVAGEIIFLAAGAMAVMAGLLLLSKIAREKVDGNDKLENILQTLNTSRTLLGEIHHGVRLSEAAKAIVFRDQDRKSLREAVLDKLHQSDYDATFAIIDNIASRPGYENLAKELRHEADVYRNASEEEQINQVITHIERLCDEHQWTKATMQAQRLIKSNPNHLRVQALPDMIANRREERKRELLRAWDDAVKRGATDESIEILRELDLYLTPNEGLALQESARDVFRNKLHELGVQFSMAVTEKRWADALATGEQIMQDFPNSRMAQEIRERHDALKKRVEPPQS
jgi:hypothetical protein